MKFMLTLIVLFNLSAGGTEEKFFAVLHSVFGEDAEYKKILVEIPVELRREIESNSGQKFFKNIIYIWKIFNGDKLAGYAALDNVMGKAQPITFAVFFSGVLEIEHVEILKYREAYGGQVTNSDWLEQFRGESADSDLKLGSGIQSITGATISARSVTRGVNKLSILLRRIKDEL